MKEGGKLEREMELRRGLGREREVASAQIEGTGS
jgi:hypothetical protein